MDLAVAATAFVPLLLLELPDKTFVATLVLATRYRPLLAWIGVAAAFAVQCLVAVTEVTGIGRAMDTIAGHNSALSAAIEQQLAAVKDIVGIMQATSADMASVAENVADLDRVSGSQR